MPALDPSLLKKIMEKYGNKIDLEANSGILGDIVREVNGAIKFDPGIVAGYDKTYSEGYNKEDYSRADYHRYDRTVDDFSKIREIYKDPVVDKILLDRLRSNIKDNPHT